MKLPFALLRSRLLLLATLVAFATGCSTLPRQAAYELKPTELRSWFETEQQVVTSGGKYPVTLTKRQGRPVLLLHELNGQSPGALSLAHELATRGCTVYVPRFFGCFGKDSIFQFSGTTPITGGRWDLSSKETGPVRQDVKQIAAWVMKRHPGESLTVIGNCMTGAFPIELLAQPGIDTAVVSQPALPMFEKDRRLLGLPEEAFEGTLAAMQANRRKRIISFNYLLDSTAPISGQEYLAKRTKDRGLTQNHRLFVGVPEGKSLSDHGELSRELSKHPGLTIVPVKGTGWFERHSTITGAPEPDVARYRIHLYESLGL